MMNNLSFRKKAEYTALVVTLNHGISPVLGSNYVNLELLVKWCGFLHISHRAQLLNGNLVLDWNPLGWRVHLHGNSGLFFGKSARSILVLFGNSEGLGRLKMLRHAPYHTSYGHKAMRGLFGIWHSLFHNMPVLFQPIQNIPQLIPWNIPGNLILILVLPEYDSHDSLVEYAQPVLRHTLRSLMPEH